MSRDFGVIDHFPYGKLGGCDRVEGRLSIGHHMGDKGKSDKNKEMDKEQELQDKEV